MGAEWTEESPVAHRPGLRSAGAFCWGFVREDQMNICLRRRDFITLLGGGAVWPLAADAQQRPMPMVGWLSGRNSETDAHVLPAFRRGLSRQGYVEGRNVTIEYRWSDAQDDRLPALAADLVQRQAAVIAAVGGTPLVVRAVQAITTAIPMVSAAVSPDTVSFRRPGGNVTGVYAGFGELGGKRMGLLRDLLPRAATIAALTTLGGSSREETNAQEAARVLGLQIKILIASTDRELDAALASLAQMRLDALTVAQSSSPVQIKSSRWRSNLRFHVLSTRVRPDRRPYELRNEH